MRFHITSLPNDEIGEYIYHRLRVAGSGGDIKFSDNALEMIYKYSGGIPRLINTVCDKALLSAYVLETKYIDAVNIEKCIKEIEGVVFAGGAG